VQVSNLYQKNNEALFNRANKMRLENKDFEEAYKIYKEILNDSPNDPEVYWGMLLCRFGIEYVKDSNGEYLPTCHRTIQTSITQDTDFLETLNNADSKAFEYYKSQGVLIDTYQKKIKAIVANEKPYDVFISFKSTDENGFPTQDSILSQKIYNYLTKDLKLKVFFSNVTLQNRAGEEYEPIIYAALRSSKVMVLVGSNADNINSTWVKNEWTRYISMIEEAKVENSKKRLIPALINMKPEEMPSELLSFQAMDMSIPLAVDKLGNSIDMFIGDEKLGNQAEVSEEKLSDNLMNKQAYNAYQFASQKLRAGQFGEAANSFKNALGNDITMAEAYWGLLLANNKAKNEEEFAKVPIEKLNEVMEYQNAYNYAKDDKKKHYESFIAKCNKSYKIKVYQNEYDNHVKELYDEYCNFSTETNISSSSKVTMAAFFTEYNNIDKNTEECFKADLKCRKLTKERIRKEAIVGFGNLLVGILCLLMCNGTIKVEGFWVCAVVVLMIPTLLYGSVLVLKIIPNILRFKVNTARQEKAQQNLAQQKQAIYQRFYDVAKDSEKETGLYNEKFKQTCEYGDEITYAETNIISSNLFKDDVIEELINDRYRQVYDIREVDEQRREEERQRKKEELLRKLRK